MYGRDFRIVAFLLMFFAGASVVYSAAPPREADSLDARRPLVSASSAEPAYGHAFHNIGKLVLYVNNWGTFGSGTYPKGSSIHYLYTGAIWVSCTRQNDSLVSVGTTGWSDGGGEFDPYEAPFGDMIYRSTLHPDSPGYKDAVSEQDYIAVYTDTSTSGDGQDYFRPGRHKPLPVEITQKSYAWSEGYADDFVTFDFRVKNVGTRPLSEVYIGFYVDGDVYYVSPGGDPLPPGIGPYDDICGYLPSWPSAKGCGFVDTLGMPWIADNDGDPYGPRFVHTFERSSCTGVQGLLFLQAPPWTERKSFNWWVSNSDPEYDFGPMRRPPAGELPHDFRTGSIGTPLGDRNKYYLMSNGEMDYDQIYTDKIKPSDANWMYPSEKYSHMYSRGADVRYLYSVGPYDIGPDEELSLAMAYVAGENLHQYALNYWELRDGRPESFYANLDFSDFAKNAMWARWVYDNPGVDTDSDGYAGKSRICVLDSVWIDDHWVPTLADTSYYAGDGVPDWRAVTPPPAPTFWLYPTNHGIRVRFNGRFSETTKDIFSGLLDFEGYRVYVGRDDREASLALAASYDRQNYDKYVFNPNLPPPNNYEIQDVPFTLEQLRCLYGEPPDRCADSLFDPLRYTITYPYYLKGYRDSLFAFAQHDGNRSRFGITTPIKKTYPDAPKPEPADTLDPEALTPDGYLKYYEYKFTFDNLLPTIPYYINVTAFDFGSPRIGLTALENAKTVGVKHAYPLGEDSDTTANRKVYVYPNPYRVNAGYRQDSYEGRGEGDRIDDRLRAIHFVNLPAKCIIRIYTLDGDLVRAIKHDMEPSDPNSSHDKWDLINRNIQMVVSGLYYWVVEDQSGNVQMGKLVILF